MLIPAMHPSMKDSLAVKYKTEEISALNGCPFGALFKTGKGEHLYGPIRNEKYFKIVLYDTGSL